ncbi:S9 family peptidase [Sandarakinorhabdus oryzae]|uniref:S9 family peptidase n=1 Tax=Sandarakinorhabdus oryzae TaxID=2675220 RepID=UPI0018CC2FDD|nr:S9 family peptidase [Sandarakinorhabdus oryzae]
MQPAQMVAMASVANPRLSPDGRRLVHEQTRADWQANRIITDLWIVDLASGQTRPLTRGKGSAGEAAWSADGRWIAYMSDAGEKDGRQLVVLPAEGGEPVTLTSAPSGVTAFRWSPDGKSIAYLAAGERPARLTVRDKALGGFRIVRGDHVPVQVWLADVSAALSGANPAPPPRALTPADGPSVTSLDFAPDGQRIAFAAQATPELATGETSEIYTVAVAGGPVQQLTRGGGPNTQPLWSPDGSWIAFATVDGARNSFFANHRLARVPATGGAMSVLTTGFDEDANPVAWHADGLYFSARAGTQAGLWRIAPDSGAISRVDLGPASIATGFSRSADGSALAFVGSAANQVPEIMLVTGGQTRSLTHMADQWQGRPRSQREVISWTSADGTRIEGILQKPADYDPARRYPLMVIIHGGPTGIDLPDVRPDRYYPAEWFVARGALVLRPNYRGSAGYGAKFRALNYRNLGLGDHQDVIAGVDMLVRQGHVDPARVASMGWSQGGYISAFNTTYSTRFKAVSVGAGISDWLTYYANTDITPFTRQYLGATPWRDPDIYRRTSPITYVNKAQTPTLIQHGSNDARVPIANAYELRLALEDRGVPVKMVVYDGFGHAINKPRQMVAVLAENMAWFGHHIWGDPLPADLDPGLPAYATPEPDKDKTP